MKPAKRNAALAYITTHPGAGAEEVAREIGASPTYVQSVMRGKQPPPPPASRCDVDLFGATFELFSEWCRLNDVNLHLQLTRMMRDRMLWRE